MWMLKASQNIYYCKSLILLKHFTEIMSRFDFFRFDLDQCDSDSVRKKSKGKKLKGKIWERHVSSLRDGQLEIHGLKTLTDKR